MDYTNENDMWNSYAYKFARGVGLLVSEKQLAQITARLPEGAVPQIEREDFGNGVFEAKIVNTIDMPAPALEGERTVDYGRYTIQKPWPVDASASGGSSGLVFRADGSRYNTAFFEVSLAEPSTFLRGEAETIEDAEVKAWAQYQRITADDHEHEFETRGYTNGAGFCKHCSLFQSNVFTLQEIGSVCHVCGDDMHTRIGDVMYCEAHQPSREERRRLREEAARQGKYVSPLEGLFDALAEDV